MEVDEYPYDWWYEYINVVENGISWYGLDDHPGDHEYRIRPAALMPAEVNIGQVYISEVCDYYCNGVKEDIFKLTIVVEGIEEVTVPAGTFSDCIRLLWQITGMEGDSQSNQSWWAKDVGEVKFIGIAGEASKKRKTLLSATVGGKNYGSL